MKVVQDDELNRVGEALDDQEVQVLAFLTRLDASPCGVNEDVRCKLQVVAHYLRICVDYLGIVADAPCHCCADGRCATCDPDGERRKGRQPTW